jgi:hypothetical protein
MVYSQQRKKESHPWPMQSNTRDNQPTRWKLPPEYRELLTETLRGSRTRRSVTTEQRVVIRRICSAPERWNYTPEDFLIAFKLAIVDAANDGGIPPGPDRTDFLAKLVSVYIDEFYRSPAPVTSSDSNGAREIAPS